MNVGIDLINFATSDYYLDFNVYAKEKGIDIDKFTIGIDQQKMSIAPPDEDIITLAAKATTKILDQITPDKITALYFATESSVDQSKSAGSFLHGLLGLSKRCRTFELKHACYAATAALQMAIAQVKVNPNEKILVVASDIARYDLGSSGEATQGCGAVAMLITANPRIIAIEDGSGFYTEDVMDFWRPNYRETALVDGKFSAKIYLKALKETWLDFNDKTGRVFKDIDYYCYHIPFTKMAKKAHLALIKTTKESVSNQDFLKQSNDALEYNRIVGNSYCASLYISFCSLLDHVKSDVTDKRVSFFSYGSGCVAEFFTGVIQPEYKTALFSQTHKQNLDKRQALDYDNYIKFYYKTDTLVENINLPKLNKGKYRFTGIKDHKRIYVRD